MAKKLKQITTNVHNKNLLKITLILVDFYYCYKVGKLLSTFGRLQSRETPTT